MARPLVHLPNSPDYFWDASLIASRRSRLAEPRIQYPGIRPGMTSCSELRGEQPPDRPDPHGPALVPRGEAGAAGADADRTDEVLPPGCPEDAPPFTAGH